MSDNLKEKTKSGIVWSAVERFSVQGVQFIIMLFMARLLSPYDYGIIGMLSVFFAISYTIIDSGFSQALIRKTDRTEIDNSTVFYFNIVVGLFMYLLCFVGAPFVADFYGIEELCPVMRVVSVTLFINSLVVVQRALLTANINFKTQAKATFAAVLVSGLTGLFLAYRGYGVWAIVWQQILSVAINALMLCFMTKWMPVWAFSWSSFKELFGFGSKLMLSGLLDTTYNNIKPLLVGKIFSAGDLGHYSRAEHFATFPSSNVNGVVQRVTYPVLVQLKDDDERLANNYRKLLRVSAFVIFPLMVGLAGVSNAFVRVVIGDKWTFCAELLQIICFSMMWYPVHSINLNLLQVKGRSDLFLRLEVIKKVVGLSILACSIVFGIKAMCYGAIIGGFIAIFINTYYTGKLINVGFFMQMKDLAGTFLTCMAMFALILLFNSFVPNLWAQLVGGVLLGAAFFFAVVKLLKFPELEHLSSFLKKK